jgi:hypothetical protein
VNRPVTSGLKESKGTGRNMKNISGLGLLAGLALAACAPGGGGDMTPVASGGSAGAQGPEYCETVPTDPNEMTQWNELCSPEGRR